MMVRNKALFVTLSLTLSLTLACNAVSVVDGGGGSGANEGGGGIAKGPECEVDLPGASFTFTFVNQRATPVAMFFGCGDKPPIEVDTGRAELQGIGAGSADFCEANCDDVFAGQANNGCSDCGPGVWTKVEPGESMTLQWDRRVYLAHSAPPHCSGNEDGNQCALGTLVGPNQMLPGFLTLCTADPTFGGCSGADELIAIGIDTSTDGVTVNL